MFCDMLSKSLLPDYEVVCVGDGRALLRIAAEFQPDVVILDIGMPVLNGLDAARELRNRLPGVKLIFLTMNTDPYIAKPKDLTDREKQILQLFAEGKSAKEVANTLGIAIRTVWYHKYRIMEALGCKSTAELVLYAVKHAMISPPQA